MRTQYLQFWFNSMQQRYLLRVRPLRDGCGLAAAFPLPWWLICGAGTFLCVCFCICFSPTAIYGPKVYKPNENWTPAGNGAPCRTLTFVVPRLTYTDWGRRSAGECAWRHGDSFWKQKC